MSKPDLVAVLAESDVAALLTPKDALDEMRSVFESMALETTRNFPVVRERLGDAGTIFGIKSAAHAPRRALGLKAGGHFPQAPGLNGMVGGHQSSIVLFDPETGALRAIVGGNLITRLRTAAAAALSIQLLARTESCVLGIIGTGTQAEAHIRAACSVRPFDRVLLHGRGVARAQALAAKLADLQASVEIVPTARDAVEAADVVITLTPSTLPIVEMAWVRAGTHFACMGADTAGKQEVATSIVQQARVFTDSISQAATIGECQAAARATADVPFAIEGTLGEILLGRTGGRRADEITLFDGTGVAAQDLAMAALALERRARRGSPVIAEIG